MERKREFMSDAVWDKILHGYVVPYRTENLHCPPTFIGHKDGEPLIDRKFLRRLAELSIACPDMRIDIYSHGLLLPKWEARGEDVFAFLGELPNRVRYLLSYHPHNHDESANDYTRTVAYLRDVLHHPPPNVEFITTSHQSRWVTEQMQQAWRASWDGLPITVHCNTHINPWTGRIEEGTVKFAGCPYGDFGHWFFGTTGNVIACCLDLEEEIVLGNVLRDDPAEMFAVTTEFYAEQRRLWQAKEPVKHQVCANCFGQQRSDLLELGTRL